MFYGRIPIINFEECLKRGRIKEFSQGKDLIQKELETAEKDLNDAKEGFARAKYKWTTIQCYYAMFHYGRTLLYAKNYREKSHYCLIVALKHLYVDTGILPTYFIEAIKKGKALREDADYYNNWSKTGTEEMIELAETLLSKTKEIANKEK